MSKALALAFAVALAGSVIASEEETIKLKVYVDGMSCPTGCAPKVAKGLAAVQGAKDVKMEDFEKGLFTFSLDGKSKLDAKAIEKSLGEYKVKKLEATVTGTISDQQTGQQGTQGSLPIGRHGSDASGTMSPALDLLGIAPYG